jgi:hypothetical protein
MQPEEQTMKEMTIFGLERLENRVLLAVDINQSGNTLTITGDGNDETISVYDGPNGGVAVAFDEDGGGSSDYYGVFYGVKHVTINTNGGYDLVTVSDLKISGNLNINTGGEGDFVYLGYFADNVGFGYGNYGEVVISGSVSIDTGDGYDLAAAFNGVTISKALTINTGNQGDRVYVGSEEYDLSVSGTTTINTGNGYDYVYIGAYGYSDSEVHLKNLNINTGDGGDFVLFTTIGVEGGGGGDIEIHGNTSINTGNGYDYVVFFGYNSSYQLDFDGSLTVNTGNNDDRVVFDGEVDVHRAASIDLGSGDDEFHAFGAEGFGYGSVDFFRKFDLKGQDGYDHVEADQNVYFHAAAKFDGGSDFDEIFVDNANFYGAQTIKKFEFID